MQRRYIFAASAAVAVLLAGCTGNDPNGSSGKSTVPILTPATSGPATSGKPTTAPSSTTKPPVKSTPTRTTQPPAACSVSAGWNTRAETGPGRGTGTIQFPVRVGDHAPCYERVSIDLNTRAVPYYNAQYVQQVKVDGSGHTLRVNGAGKLQLVLGDYRPSPGKLPTVGERLVTNDQLTTAGIDVITDIRFGGYFEGYTLFGIGVSDGKRPFRVAIDQSSGHTVLYVDFAIRR